MTWLRRWFDPLRSRWYYNRRRPQTTLSVEQGLKVYLRLDDVYSYLAAQQLRQLDDILADSLKPLQLIFCSQHDAPPNGMTAAAWQQYSLHDAHTLAKQHRFHFDEQPELPSSQAIAQASDILQRSPLRGQDFLYLLEDVFHMLWQQQHGKLRTLHNMATQQHPVQNFPERQFLDQAILNSFFEFGGRHYHAVDDILRMTRRLKQQKLLTGNPIFLTNHIEWREHLLSDAEELATIQAMHPELDVYLALEDPISWLLLAYIEEELAAYYNTKLTIYPLSYQGRDAFDWGLSTRLSKRCEVAFTPFCRPDAAASLNMATLFYSVPEDEQIAAAHRMMRMVWSHGKDLAFAPHLSKMQEKLGIEALTKIDVAAQLAQNDAHCAAFTQPNLPVMELRVAGQRYVFNSLYRVWMIESIFNQVLQDAYKADDVAEIRE